MLPVSRFTAPLIRTQAYRPCRHFHSSPPQKGTSNIYECFVTLSCFGVGLILGNGAKRTWNAITEKNKPSLIEQVIANPSRYTLSEIGDVKRSFAAQKNSFGAQHQTIQKIYDERMQPAREKCQRALKEAQKLGKGLSKLEKMGYQGCVMGEQYWCEALTSGRYNSRFTKLMFDTWNLSKTTDSFNTWISSRLSEGCDGYFTEETRKKYEIKIKDGKLLLPKISISDTSRKIFIFEFVIGSDLKVYGSQENANSPHHSFFVAGEPVLGAGSLICNKEFKVLSISNFSGHYKPEKEHVLQTLSYFEERGIDLTGVKLCLADESYVNKFHIHSASDYLQTKGACPIQDSVIF